MYVSIVSEYVQSTAAASAWRRTGEGGRAQSYGGGDPPGTIPGGGGEISTSNSHRDTPSRTLPRSRTEKRTGKRARKALQQNGYRKEVKGSSLHTPVTLLRRVGG